MGKGDKDHVKYKFLDDTTLDPAPEANMAHTARWQQCLPHFSRQKVVSLLIIILVTMITLTYLSCSSRNGQSNVFDSLMTGGKMPVVSTELYTQESNSTDTTRKHREQIRFMHTKRQLPQCLIIGARKAGTRALLTFLDLHPQIRTAKNEVHFFDDDETYQLGLDWYRKRMPFSFSDQIVMEKTPAYFTSHSVPERVHKMNSSIKLLLVVRDPVERAVSDYLQIHYNKMTKGKPDYSFEQYVLMENGEIDRTYEPVKRSLYARHMEFWMRYFPLSQFLILSAENLVRKPVQEMRKVEKFLNLQHKITDDLFYFNKTRGFFCIRNETEERCLAESKGRRHPDINPLVINKLQDFFRPFNQKFYQMVNRDFGWP